MGLCVDSDSPFLLAGYFKDSCEFCSSVIKEKKMKGAVLAAIAASIGNFLQGWDNATIAGTHNFFLLAFLECLHLIFLLFFIYIFTHGSTIGIIF